MKGFRIPRSVLCAIPLIAICILPMMGEKIPQGLLALVSTAFGFYFSAKSSELSNGKH